MECIPLTKNKCPCGLWTICLVVGLLLLIRSILLLVAFILTDSKGNIWRTVFQGYLMGHSLLAGFNGAALIWGILRTKPRWIRCVVFSLIDEQILAFLGFAIHLAGFTEYLIIHAFLLSPFSILLITSIFAVNIYWKMLVKVLKELG